MLLGHGIISCSSCLMLLKAWGIDLMQGTTPHVIHCRLLQFVLIIDEIDQIIKYKDGLISVVLLGQILVIYLCCWLYSWQGKCC